MLHPKSLILSCLIGIALYINTAEAVEVTDLYLVKWPVTAQSKAARWKASLAGFKEVLIRKSGSQAILQSYEVQQAYSKVTSYLHSFEYSRIEDPSDEFPYLISLYFEPRLIDNIIRDSKMPLWGSNRPVTILWIAVEEDFKRRILKDQIDAESSQISDEINEPNEKQSLTLSIKENATRRGLPVISPLMDLEDELVVSISDIWGRFPSTVLQASQRYSADSVILGRIRKNGEQWRGEFTYINQPVQSSFEVSAEQPQQVIGQMVDKLAELLCNKYCVVEEVGQKNEVLMNVSGINNFKTFKAAEDYLNQLSANKRTDVVKIEQHNVTFKLTLLGQIESLIEGIRLSQQMQVDESSEALAIKNTDKNINSHDPQNDNTALQNDNIGNNSNDSLSPEQTGTTSQTGTTEPQSQDIGMPNSLDNIQLKKLQNLYYRWLG